MPQQYLLLLSHIWNPFITLCGTKRGRFFIYIYVKGNTKNGVCCGTEHFVVSKFLLTERVKTVEVYNKESRHRHIIGHQYFLMQ